MPSPAAALLDRLTRGAGGLDQLDGAFAGAWWDGEHKSLTLIRDPFGVRSLYYAEHGGVFYFASELKQLLAVPVLPVQVNPVSLHKYLTFSFVPGDDVPVMGVRRLLPGTGFTIEPGLYFEDFGVRTEINMIMYADHAVVTGPRQAEIVALG